MNIYKIGFLLSIISILIFGCRPQLSGEIAVIDTLDFAINLIDLRSGRVSLVYKDDFGKHDVEWLKGGQDLIFVSDYLDNHVLDPRLFIVNVKSGEAYYLQDLVASPVDVSVSPTGEGLAYSGMYYDSDIYFYDLNSGISTNFTNSTENEMNPDWSPDGQSIVFESDKTGTMELFIMSRDGTNAVQITNTGTNNREAAWSPLGNKIAFSSDRSGKWEIYLMDIDGSNVVLLPNNGTNSIRPAWSPDGQHIVFISEIVVPRSFVESPLEIVPHRALYVYDMKASKLFTIADLNHYYESPSWSN